MVIAGQLTLWSCLFTSQGRLDLSQDSAGHCKHTESWEQCTVIPNLPPHSLPQQIFTPLINYSAWGANISGQSLFHFGKFTPSEYHRFLMGFSKHQWENIMSPWDREMASFFVIWVFVPNIAWQRKMYFSISKIHACTVADGSNFSPRNDAGISEWLIHTQTQW